MAEAIVPVVKEESQTSKNAKPNDSKTRALKDNLFFSLKSWATFLVKREYFPCIRFAKAYPRNFKEWFLGDLISGISVLVMLIPMALAYAFLAGVPPEIGLYSAFMGLFAYAIFGTSRAVTVGPTAITSLLILTELSTDGETVDPILAASLAFYTGIVCIALFVFRIGYLLDLLSKPVLNGFISGAAITIGVSQLKYLFGIQHVRSGFIYLFIDFLPHIAETQWDLLIGSLCMLTIYGLSWFNRGRFNNTKWSNIAYSKNFVQVVIATLLTAFIPAIQNNVATVGELPPGLPNAKVPDVSSFSRVIASAVVMAAVANLQHYAIGKPFSRTKNIECDIDGNQEILSVGIANLANSFMQGFPVCGCFTRTAVNVQSGVRTPFAGIITGILMIISLEYITPAFKYIPNASLAAIILMSVLGLLKVAEFSTYWHTNDYANMLTMMVTFFVTVFVGSLEGIGSGVVVSILIILWRMTRPKISLDYKSDVVKMTFYGDLTFLAGGAINTGFDTVNEYIVDYESGQKLVEQRVVFDLKNVRHIDVDATKRITDRFTETWQDEPSQTGIDICDPLEDSIATYTLASIHDGDDMESQSETSKKMKESSKEPQSTKPPLNVVGKALFLMDDHINDSCVEKRVKSGMKATGRHYTMENVRNGKSLQPIVSGFRDNLDAGDECESCA